MNKETFILEVEKLGIEVTPDKLEKLNQFYQLLIEWNQKINLTTIIEEESVYLKHFYDSLTLFRDYDLNQNIKLCDVGSGAGFPGIILKIFFPNLEVTLIDSLNKRIVYLNDVITKLDLKNIEAVHGRMEEYSRKHEEKFDMITARAVASIKVLSEICVRSLKINGYLLFMKGNCDEELDNAKTNFSNLSLKIINIDKFLLPIEKSNRTIIKMQKTNKTDKKYPRKFDKIK